jgi:hypothetical protein
VFIDNKYTKWYYRIINKYQLDSKGVGIEGHHIIPKCMGGTNQKINICLVSSKAHFILHKLLVKMVVDIEYKRKLQYAVWRMINPQNKNHSRKSVRKNSREYENIRQIISKYTSENNPMKRDDVVFKRTGVIRPEQSVVCSNRNITYWSDNDNKHKRYLQCLARAIKSGFVYEITLPNDELVYFYMEHNVKKYLGWGTTKIRWAISKNKINNGYTIKKVRVDSVSKFNPQDSVVNIGD